ncbi:hypothetical protein [uncultured Microbacterium sp.]|uniref:hypothetical protein n=1 Tax=uncultured Microbacterium sp. TaxID=191216 RepID=UPI0025E1F6FA|nr:hypothetical protein [uncultured Microbacterium sp.]
MNAGETNVLLVKVMVRDKYPRWRTPQELAVAANEWADDLPHVSLDDALAAMRAHYAVSDEPMTIRDVNEFAPLRSSSHAGNVTEQRLAAERAELTS